MNTEKIPTPQRARKSCWPSSPKWLWHRSPPGSLTPEEDWRRKIRWRGPREIDLRTMQTMIWTMMRRTICCGKTTVSSIKKNPATKLKSRQKVIEVNIKIHFFWRRTMLNKWRKSKENQNPRNRYNIWMQNCIYRR